MKSVDFIAYKQHLVRYLEEFIQDLQQRGTDWGTAGTVFGGTDRTLF